MDKIKMPTDQFKVAIVLGTARKNGNTAQMAQHLSTRLNAELFDLADFDISPYDYQHRNQFDDFLGLIEKLLEFDHIILASPMYWYAVSAQMKIFIDRLSDLLNIKKDLGRQLRSKTASLIATGYDQKTPLCFEQSIQLTLEYLGMKYTGMLYCSCGDNDGFIETQHQDNLQKYLDASDLMLAI